MIKSVRFSKTILTTTVFLTAILWAGTGALWAAVASVQNAQGDVFVLKAGSAPDAWVKVTGTAEVDNGDTLRTDEGTCTLQYADIASFAVEARSRMAIQSGEFEDLSLQLGKIKANVDKTKVVKPFRVFTPTAVAAIRGTQVDFDFNQDGKLIIDLHNGNIQVYNEEAGMKVDLGGKKSISVLYNAQSGILKVRNECDSDEKVVFSIQGTEYTQSPCEETEITLATEAGPASVPGAGSPDSPELPDTHTESLPPSESPVTD